MPACFCAVKRCRKDSSSKPPAEKGVTIAVMTPLNMVHFQCFARKFPFTKIAGFSLEIDTGIIVILTFKENFSHTAIGHNAHWGLGHSMSIGQDGPSHHSRATTQG